VEIEMDVEVGLGFGQREVAGLGCLDVWNCICICICVPGDGA